MQKQQLEPYVEQLIGSKLGKAIYIVTLLI